MWGPRTTLLVGGPRDGLVLEAWCLPGDVLSLDGARYEGTGRFTDDGRWEARHLTEDHDQGRAHDG